MMLLSEEAWKVPGPAAALAEALRTWPGIAIEGSDIVGGACAVCGLRGGGSLYAKECSDWLCGG